MKLRVILLDAKKAVGVATATIPAVVAAGYFDDAKGAAITAALGVISTALTYGLQNVPAKPVVPPAG